MIYEVTIGERVMLVDVARGGSGWRISVDGGEPVQVEGEALPGAEWILRVAGRKQSVGLHVEQDRFDAQVRGHAIRGTIVDPRRAALDLGTGAGQGEIRTQMPGAVVRIPVQVGQAVQKGQVLIVVEAMKMENEFKSPIAGKVAAVHVSVGQAIDATALLVTVEAE